MSPPRVLPFSGKQAEEAADAWGFNCGPAALCAVLDKTPDEIRPLMGDFECKRYTNPKLMFEVLKRAGVKHGLEYRADTPGAPLPALNNGLVRIQWGGPWTRPGVPMMARYRRTHWIAVVSGGSLPVFDINAIRIGGWITREMWEGRLVPWLLAQCVPGADGGWWPTHGIEVEARPSRKETPS